MALRHEESPVTLQIGKINLNCIVVQFFTYQTGQKKNSKIPKF